MDDQNTQPIENEETEAALPTVTSAELEQLQRERDEYLNGWQRARADFANYKKQEVDRLAEALRYSAEEIVGDIVRVLDSFDLGLAAAEKEGKDEKGMHMIRAQLEDTLKRRGLERIELSPGDPFDPSVAASIGEVDAELPPGSIALVVSPGYRLFGKVIRPAQVQLTKGG